MRQFIYILIFLYMTFFLLTVTFVLNAVVTDPTTETYKHGRKGKEEQFMRRETWVGETEVAVGGGGT